MSNLRERLSEVIFSIFLDMYSISYYICLSYSSFSIKQLHRVWRFG
jgi:hypothetical protein